MYSKFFKQFTKIFIVDRTKSIFKVHHYRKLHIEMARNKESLILTTVNHGIQKIIFDRPTKKNAISHEMYVTLVKLIKDSEKNDSVNALAFTGNGDFFSSGNDMSLTSDTPQAFYDTIDIIKNVVDALIKYPKLLIAVVNGPAIGFGATILGLFDIVYASDKAFKKSKIGFTAEGCSTYTFPQILGPSKAFEMLCLSTKLDPYEAKERGFISKVFKNEDIDKIWKELEDVSSNSLQSIMETKKLARKWNVDVLLRTNAEELRVLKKVITTEQFMNNLATYMIRRKSKM